MFFEDLAIDALPILMSFTYVLLIVGAAKKLNDMGVSSHLLRELTHISMGVWPILWLMFNTTFGAFFVPLVVTLILALAPEKIKRVFSSGDEKHIGLVLYAFSFTVITFFYFKNFAGAAAIFCLSFGDGLGGLVGSRVGKHRYKIPWVKEKSLEGSFTIFVVSFLSIVLAQVLYPGKIGINLMLSLIGSLLAAFIEAVSPYHSDNLTIPLVIAPTLYYISFTIL